jgi:hypothetical protein
VLDGPLPMPAALRPQTTTGAANPDSVGTMRKPFLIAWLELADDG